jgi:WD40 repeat protein
VLAVCWDADGQLALSGGRDRTLRLWQVAGGECLRTFAGHDDKVLAVALSADGRWALSGSADRTVRLWDVATGQCLRTCEGHQGGVTSVGLSADGSVALSGSEDRTLKLWRLPAGRCLETLAEHAGTVNSVWLSGSGRHALSASADTTLALWRLPVDQTAPWALSRVRPSETALAAWTDFERALARAREAAAAGDAVTAARHVRAARAQPGFARRPEAMREWGGLYVRLRRTVLQGGWEGEALAEHDDAVTAVCLSADGRHALSGSVDRTLRLWDTATGRCLRVFEGHRDGVTAVCLSTDGALALSGGADAALRFWDVAAGRCLAICPGQTEILTAVSLSADGRCALTGGSTGAVQLWEVPTGRRLRTFEGHPDPVHSVCLSADGRLALSGGGQFLIRNASERLFTSGQLRLWDTATGRCISAFQGHDEAVTAVSLSFDGRLALSGGGQSVIHPGSGRFLQSGQIHLWETAIGRWLRTFSGHADAVTSVCLSFDGRHALSGSADRTVRLWDVATGRCVRTFAGHADAVTSVALSADGRLAVSGGADGTLQVWILDWDLEENRPAEWDDGALPLLETFLVLHTPYAAPLPPDRKRTVKELLQMPLKRLFQPTLTEGELARALTRRGRPLWTEKDFGELLHWLGCAGYGWLRPDGVRRKLDQLARGWKRPPLAP